MPLALPVQHTFHVCAWLLEVDSLLLSGHGLLGIWTKGEGGKAETVHFPWD